jgi:hypothetical protein
VTSALSIPKAFTPPGGYGDAMPAPVLHECTEPLAVDVPDLRGTWHVVEAFSGGEALPDGHPIRNHVERIEQAANRVVITGAGIIHDMYADGSYDNGVNDVMAIDFTTPISVAASFEDGVLVLRPRDVPDVEVRRWRDGEDLMWSYHTAFTARLRQQP